MVGWIHGCRTQGCGWGGYHTILYKGLEHLQMFVCEGPGNNAPWIPRDSCIPAALFSFPRCSGPAHRRHWGLFPSGLHFLFTGQASTSYLIQHPFLWASVLTRSDHYSHLHRKIKRGKTDSTKRRWGVSDSMFTPVHGDQLDALECIWCFAPSRLLSLPASRCPSWEGGVPWADAASFRLHARCLPCCRPDPGSRFLSVHFSPDLESATSPRSPSPFWGEMAFGPQPGYLAVLSVSSWMSEMQHQPLCTWQVGPPTGLQNPFRSQYT